VIRRWRDGGAVRRFHTQRFVGTHTNAEHSWGVAVLLVHYWPDLVNERTLRWALFHDVAEVETGDVPAPIKWAHSGLRAALDTAEEDAAARLGVSLPTLHDDERWALGLCDLLDATYVALEQVELGNQTCAPVVDRALATLRARGCPDRILADLEELWPTS
jgi:hypothetical protein